MTHWNHTVTQYSTGCTVTFKFTVSPRTHAKSMCVDVETQWMAVGTQASIKARPHAITFSTAFRTVICMRIELPYFGDKVLFSYKIATYLKLFKK